jgi:ABC-type transport system involved in multi-copper enzyme maturation permease subunit
MVKPVSRFQYLMGKWLGVVLLNMLLLAVSGVGIYTLTYILAKQRVSNLTTPQIELAAVEYEVLTARQSANAVPPEGMDLAAELRRRHERLKQENPDEYGDLLTHEQRKAIQNRIIAQWHAIGPGDSQTYVFENLQPAVEQNLPLQLRFKPKMSKAPDDEMVRMALWINDRPYPNYQGQHIPTEVANDNFHVMSIDPSYVDDQGRIKLRIQNVNLMAPQATFPATISFTPGSGLEILYNIGTFGPNLVRSLAMIWVRLGFLAMLGVMAGTFLGFPVACLLSFMIYFAAIASNYLKESLRFYAGFSDANANLWEKIVNIGGAFGANIGQGKYWEAVKIVIRLVGEMFIAVVPEFSTYNPTPLVSDGRVVSMSMLGGSFLWVGLVSSGFCLLMAWLIFKRRELAKVTV